MSTKEQRKELLRLNDEEYVLPSYAVAAREAVPGLVREVYNLESQITTANENAATMRIALRLLTQYEDQLWCYVGCPSSLDDYAARALRPDAGKDLVDELVRLREENAALKVSLENEGNLLGSRTEQMETFRTAYDGMKNNRDHYKQVFEESCAHVAELLRDTLHIDPEDEPADLWALRKHVEKLVSERAEERKAINANLGDFSSLPLTDKVQKKLTWFSEANADVNKRLNDAYEALRTVGDYVSKAVDFPSYPPREMLLRDAREIVKRALINDPVSVTTPACSKCKDTGKYDRGCTQPGCNGFHDCDCKAATQKRAKNDL